VRDRDGYARCFGPEDISVPEGAVVGDPVSRRNETATFRVVCAVLVRLRWPFQSAYAQSHGEAG